MLFDGRRLSGGRGEAESGFTLVEMLVVLAILALAAGGSAYALAGSRPARLVATTTDRLVADLQRTRLDAIRTGRLRSLGFDGDARRWQRDGAAPVALAHGLVLDLTTAREARLASGAGRTAAITFMPDGRSTGGRIEIRMGEIRRVLTVNWLTGTVRRDGG